MFLTSLVAQLGQLVCQIHMVSQYQTDCSGFVFMVVARLPTERTKGYKVPWGLVLELALYYFLQHPLFQSKSQGQPRQGWGNRLHLLVGGAAKSHFRDYGIRNEWVIKANLQPVYHSHLCFSIGCFENIAWKLSKYIFIVCKKKKKKRCFSHYCALAPASWIALQISLL